MLRFNRIRNASYYLGLTRYFIQERARHSAKSGPFSRLDGAFAAIPETVPGEPPGEWLGQGLARFGLSKGQQVETLHLERLFEGYQPHDGETPVVQNAGDPGRRPAYDATFSILKGASIIYSEGGKRAEAVEECGSLALEDTVAFIQEHFGFTRAGKGGWIKLRAGLIAANFQHCTNREGEPNIHYHLLVQNAVASEDGKTRAFDARPIFYANKVIGAYFDSRYALRAAEKQLHATERDGNGFRVSGFDKRWEELDSTRSKQIKELVGEHASTKAKERAALATRKEKDEKLVSRAELRKRWKKRHREAGFSPTHFEHLPMPSMLERLPAAWQLEETLARYAPQATHFTALDLLFEAMLDSVYGADELVDALDEFLATHLDLVKLTPNDNGYMLYTTREVMEREQKLLKTATRLNEQQGAQAKEETLAAILKDRQQLPPLREGMKPGLTDEQRVALEHLTRSESSIRFLRGRAGAGKTFVLAAAAEAFKKDGFQVVGAAPSNEAKEQLEKEGIEAYTITSFLADYEVDTSEQTAEVETSWEAERTNIQVKPKTYYKKGLLKTGVLGTGFFGTKKIQREGMNWTQTKWKVPAALANIEPRQQPEPYKLTEKHVLLVDETATANLPHYQKLLDKAADAGATIILCGDERQNTPADGTISPFDSLGRAYGSAVLNEIQRQETDWQRTASRWFSDGRVASALQLYEKNDNLTLAEDEEAAIKKTIAHWLEFDGATKPADSVIVASTNFAVSHLNKLAQKKRLDRGELKGTPRAIHSIEHSGHYVDRVYPGDRVRFTGNKKISGHRISNNDSATVLYTSGIGGVAFRLDKKDRSGKQIIVTVDPNEFRQIRLGYARTDYKAQGSTLKNVLYLATSGDFHSGFVSVTRHKGRIQIVTLSELVEDLADLEKSEFARMLSEKQDLGLAVDYLPKVRAADRETAVLHLLADLRREFAAGNRSAVAVTDSPDDARDINARMQVLRAIASDNYDPKAKKLRRFAQGLGSDQLAPGDPVRFRQEHWGLGDIEKGQTGIVESVSDCQKVATVKLDESDRSIRLNLEKWESLLELTYALPFDSEHVESYERKLRFHQHRGELRELVVREEFQEVGDLAISQRQKEEKAAREKAARKHREREEFARKKRERKAQEERRKAREYAEKLEAERNRKKAERLLEEWKAHQQWLKDNPEAAAAIAEEAQRREEERQARERREWWKAEMERHREEQELREQRDREEEEQRLIAAQREAERAAKQEAESAAEAEQIRERRRRDEEEAIAEHNLSTWGLFSGPPPSSSGYVPAHEHRPATPTNSTNFVSGCNAMQTSTSQTTGMDHYTYGSAQTQHTQNNTPCYTPVATTPPQPQTQTYYATAQVSRIAQAQTE